MNNTNKMYIAATDTIKKWNKTKPTNTAPPKTTKQKTTKKLFFKG